MDTRPAGRRGPSWTSRAMWFVRARPVDYLLAVSRAYAALPIVGRFLEPLGGFAAMGVWGSRHALTFFSAAARNTLAPGVAELRRQQREQTTAAAAAALRGIVAPDRLDGAWPAPDRLAPVLRGLSQRRRYLHRGAVRYGGVRGQVLDVWRRRDLPGPAPVLLYVPGGAWVHGSRTWQGHALMSHLAEQGWVCLSIDYRVAPHHPWPRHVHDVKAAVAWTRANVDRFGGDRDFVAIAGGSAGGHLATLTGLTHDDHAYHTDLPADADTSVNAVVSLYGRYDWEDRSTPERARFVDFLERVVVQKRLSRHPELFRQASPIARVRSDAPPTLIVHGTSDTVIPIAQARAFVDRLRAASRSTVGYLELPGAGHAFDMTDGARTAPTTMAIGLFLGEIYRSHVLARGSEVM